MKVAVDLDGVCYEWDRTARYMLREYRGQAHLARPSETWWEIRDSVPAEDWAWLWKEGVALGLFRYGHMVKGCRIGLQEIAKHNRIEVVTHRPASAVSDTLDWISLYFKDIPLHGLHILTNQEPKTISDADLLVDDKPDNVVQWEGTGRLAILFDRPHNRDLGEGVPVWRAADWAHTAKMIERVRRGRV